MAANLKDVLVSVWRQSRVEEANSVELEQNLETRSRWAQLAREGKTVMRFLAQGRYIAVILDGKVKFHGKSRSPRLKRTG